MGGALNAKREMIVDVRMVILDSISKMNRNKIGNFSAVTRQLMAENNGRYNQLYQCSMLRNEFTWQEHRKAEIPAVIRQLPRCQYRAGIAKPDLGHSG
jgi:hypothetical protein